MQRAGVSPKDCTLEFWPRCGSSSLGSLKYLTNGNGALVQKWNSILLAVYGGATLVTSRQFTIFVPLRVSIL